MQWKRKVPFAGIAWKDVVSWVSVFKWRVSAVVFSIHYTAHLASILQDGAAQGTTPHSTALHILLFHTALYLTTPHFIIWHIFLYPTLHYFAQHVSMHHTSALNVLTSLILISLHSPVHFSAHLTAPWHTYIAKHVSLHTTIQPSTPHFSRNTLTTYTSTFNYSTQYIILHTSLTKVLGHQQKELKHILPIGHDGQPSFNGLVVEAFAWGSVSL